MNRSVKDKYRPNRRLHYLRMPDEKLLSACRVDIYKATGKGGQKKNKTSNAVRLTLLHLSVTESKSRSKAENVRNALKKLRLSIATDYADVTNEQDHTTPLPQELEAYFSSDKIRISQKNSVYPLFVAFLFDAYARHKGDWSAMSGDLGFTASQLRKFFEKTPELNRAAIGLKQFIGMEG